MPYSSARCQAHPKWPWTVAIAVLLATSVVLAWFAVQRIFTLPAINYDEGWNAYRDRMAASGVPLYGTPPHFWITNYPFLSFHVVGLLGRAIGSMTVAGRVIAFTALIVICLLLVLIVHKLTGIWRGGLYAALCFFLWTLTFAPGRVAMNDPDPLAASLALFGVYAYLRGRAGSGWFVVSAVAFATAMFTKQDIVALPLGIGLHALITGPRRRLAIWLATGLLATTVLLLATRWLDGPYLIAHLFRPRAYKPMQALDSAVRFLKHFATALVPCCLLPLRRNHLEPVGLLLLAFVIAVAFAGGDGVGRNIFNVPMIVMAAIAGIALCTFESRLAPNPASSILMVLMLTLPILPGIIDTPAQLAADRAVQHTLPARTRAAFQTIALLQRLHGPALCQNILLCYQAGKPIGPDLFFVHDQVTTGELAQADIVSEMIAHQFAAIQLDTPIKPEVGRSRFFNSFMQALRNTYRPVMIGPVNAVFVPRRTNR
ncbi:MAG TPA: glycosyltransferase family 39 protein [Acidiphilium sp.]|nr:glycosyltransferase family 39 protein [Acidiphilium sp.]